MWKKIYNALWANKARRAVIVVVLLALLVSGASLAVINAVNGSKPVQNVADSGETQPTSMADVQPESTAYADSKQEETTRSEIKQTEARTKESSENQTEGESGLPQDNKPAGQDNTGTTAPSGTDESTSQAAENVTAESSTEETTAGDNGSHNNGYYIRFATAGGSSIAPRTVSPGTRISSLPTPYMDDNIFMGWYYDEELTRPVLTRDEVYADLTLYASYSPAKELEPVENVVFTAEQDVDAATFNITVVTEDKTLDAQAVMAALEAKNLTDPEQTNIIEVSGGDGVFVITGRNPVVNTDSSTAIPGFEDGCTYRITLNDLRLNYENQPESVREYNFTTTKEEVLNVALNSDIIYIPVSDLRNITNDGKQVETLSIALYKADSEGTLGPAQLTEGEFDYSKGTLKVGDIVSVYAGLRPDLRTLDTPDDQNGDIAYVEITGKSGKRYSYKNAAPEDVIFTPDILPISDTALADGTDGAVTVSNRALDYSADVYANIGLDSQTTVDEGDYLVFYSGIFGIYEGDSAAQLESYALVTSVVDNNDGTTTIGYELTDWAEVQQTMDIYTSNRMSGAEMIEGVDVAAIEASIEQQAIDSGFAEEAAQYLASLALATENFTKLSDNMNLEDYKITLEDGTLVSPEQLQLMSSDISVECELEDGYPKATISTHPQKLGDAQGSAASDKGLSVMLEVKANIKMGKKGSEDQLVITVSGTFTEEVGLDLGVSSQAVWKVWGIFPYIAEYRVTANIDVLNYTGIEVSAVMVTKNSDDDDDDENKSGFDTALDIADQIKELIDEAKDSGENEDSEENANRLVQRYSDMMEEESDWIKIFEQNIIDQEKLLPPCLPIIAVNLEVNFVVKVDACVAVGFDFEYITGKRYIYTIDVFAGKVYNDTVQLIEDSYEFDFYVMGRLAVKAGLEFEFKVGLFSTDIASVGFTAEAGAYTKLWGYFYYELKYSQSEGKTQQYCGALLIDVGAYLEVALEAQAIKGRYSTQLTLYDNEWSLWTVGNRDSILDFTTVQEDMPYVKLKQHVRSAVIPDSVFDMTYLDLVVGGEDHAVYNDYYDPTREESSKNRKNFEITMTNDKFSYDPQTNTVTVNPSRDDKKLEGEMIITWNAYPLAFSSKPIQRTISLYWDNLRDGYVIVPYTNGGSYINIINAGYEKKIAKPADPVKVGYVFAGWYLDEELTQEYEFPELMPAYDTNIYAKWTPAEDTPYRVEHYKEQILTGEYELADTQELTGTTNSYVTPEVKTYTGYDSPAAQEIRIEADGSTVLRYYYSLEWHTVTFNEGEAGDESMSFNLKYGATIVPPIVAADGYTFVSWDKTVESVMGTEDVVYTALWKKNPDTQYRVEYYVQDIDGSYRLQDLFEAEGYTGAEITAESLRNKVLDKKLTADEKFTVDGGIEFRNMTVLGEACDTTNIAPDGKMIIKINYRRVNYSYTFDFGYDDKVITADTCYLGEIDIPENVTREGYIFKGWSIDGKNVVKVNPVMGKSDVRYVALWTPITYTVHFDANHKDSVGVMEDMVFTYDVNGVLAQNGFTLENYVFGGWSLSQKGELCYADGEEIGNLTAVDGSTVVLYAVWIPVEFNITYENLFDAVNPNTSVYTVESGTITLRAAVRKGYVFEGWYDNEELEGDAVTTIKAGSAGDITLYAAWSPATDTEYRVEHYLEQFDGTFALDRTDVLTGVTEQTVTPETVKYEGFTAPEPVEAKINADGSTVVRYEYKRNSYTITFDANEGSLEGDGTITAMYGQTIVLPVPAREGYGFGGWYEGDVRFDDATMPARNMALTAVWNAGEYGYTVNHYQQNVDGSDKYTLVNSVHLTAPMDSEVEAVINSYEGFTSPETQLVITIGVDESKNVVDYYYTRNQYSLAWNLAGGEAEGYTEGMVYYGAPVTVPVPVKYGYSYIWDKTPAVNMPAENIEYTAVWTADTYIIALDPAEGALDAGTELIRKVVFDSPYGELPTPVRKGYSFDGWFTQPQNSDEAGLSAAADAPVKLAYDHTVYAHYTPIEYKITYNNIDGAVNANPDSYNVTSERVELVAPVRTGFTFKGWYDNKELAGDAVTVISTAGMRDMELYAKWSENSYKVVYHSNNGGDITDEESFTYTESRTLAKNIYEKDGYEFTGWSLKAGQSAKYTDEELVTGLVAEDGGVLHLYAVWTPVRYKIIYENMEGAQNADNPDSFTVEDDYITLREPVKKGYTFGGWYKDAGFKNKVTGAMKLDRGYDWIFYAKWTANKYVITFDSCLGSSVPTETLEMEYDKSANLPLIDELAGFSRPGYTFLGWALEKDGEPVYKDGATVINLAESGNINFYAVWRLNVFSISYEPGVGAISNDNPSSYSIEDNDVKINAPEAKEGYQFLGWYDGETLVSEIVKGTQRDYNLTAKWGCGGTFNLSFVGEEEITLKDGSTGSKLTYKVTRTLPEGTQATPNPLYVYYRTVNGTAYGSTVDIDIATDKYHFKHVGGEDVYLTFGPNDMELTFTVEEWGAVTSADAAASYNSNNTDRYYDVELYKNIDTVGKYPGTIGDSKSIRRTVKALSKYKVEDIYNQWFKHVHSTGDPIIETNKQYTVDYANKGKTFYFDSLHTALANAGVDAVTRSYIKNVATQAGFYITADVLDIDDSWCWVRLYSNSAGYIGEFVFDITAGDWQLDVAFPFTGSSQGNIAFKYGKGDWTKNNYGTSYNGNVVVGGSPTYAKIGVNEQVQLEATATGKNGNKWQLGTTDEYYKVFDTKAPSQVGISSLALSQYKAGEQITLTVIYDEVIGSVQNIGLNAIEGLPIENVQFVDGVGTNALTFTGTLTEDFEVTPNFNNDIKALKPVTGTVSDILGNHN